MTMKGDQTKPDKPPFDRLPCMGEDDVCEHYVTSRYNGCLTELRKGGKHTIPKRFITGYKCFSAKNKRL